MKLFGNKSQHSIPPDPQMEAWFPYDIQIRIEVSKLEK